MGIPVLIMGESGSGKSTSLRNFDPDEIGIMNVASKPLPFRKKMRVFNSAQYGGICAVLGKSNLNCYAIDDSQALMAFSMFSKAKEAGYNKFTDIALDFYNLLQFIINKTPPDCVVYLLHHTEQTDTGKIKAKTVGKMLDNQLTVEGLFSIVLLARTDGSRHYFETQSDGFTTCKSPMDMLPREMDNDLALVDNAIRAYWQLAPRKRIEQEKPAQTKANAA